jgi:caffeoyl-CoA O-methyltransferase
VTRRPWRVRPWWPAVALLALAAGPEVLRAQDADLDARVTRFLERHRYAWRDMNVPTTDGQLLHDLIVERGFTRALEIGTSTGHSAVWIAWALSRTGGRLITIEIDEDRHRQALENFAAAGLSDYIDARLADAHTLVPELEGPFDFVFLDADKAWYSRYFQAVLPKLAPGACFTAHNISSRRIGWVAAFLDAVEAVPDMTTEIVGSMHSGISVSCRR